MARSEVRDAAAYTTTKNKSVGIAGLRGTTTYARGVERAGTMAEAATTKVAKKDACIAYVSLTDMGLCVRKEKAWLGG